MLSSFCCAGVLLFQRTHTQGRQASAHAKSALGESRRAARIGPDRGAEARSDRPARASPRTRPSTAQCRVAPGARGTSRRRRPGGSSLIEPSATARASACTEAARAGSGHDRSAAAGRRSPRRRLPGPTAATSASSDSSLEPRYRRSARGWSSAALDRHLLTEHGAQRELESAERAWDAQARRALHQAAPLRWPLRNVSVVLGFRRDRTVGAAARSSGSTGGSEGGTSAPSRWPSGSATMTPRC